jgi:hypothetical protein
MHETKAEGRVRGKGRQGKREALVRKRKKKKHKETNPRTTP